MVSNSFYYYFSFLPYKLDVDCSACMFCLNQSKDNQPVSSKRRRDTATLFSSKQILRERDVKKKTETGNVIETYYYHPTGSRDEEMPTEGHPLLHTAEPPSVHQVKTI